MGGLWASEERGGSPPRLASRSGLNRTHSKRKGKGAEKSVRKNTTRSPECTYVLGFEVYLIVIIERNLQCSDRKRLANQS